MAVSCCHPVRPHLTGVVLASRCVHFLSWTWSKTKLNRTEWAHMVLPQTLGKYHSSRVCEPRDKLFGVVLLLASEAGTTPDRLRLTATSGPTTSRYYCVTGLSLRWCLCKAGNRRSSTIELFTNLLPRDSTVRGMTKTFQAKKLLRWTCSNVILAPLSNF